jgi:hypothetical protein
MQKTLIRTKKHYYDLAMRGLAGNSPMTWSSCEDFLSDSCATHVGIRDIRPGSSNFRGLVPREKLETQLKKLGMSDGDYYLTATFRSRDQVRLAGELTWHNGQWVFFYSLLPMMMRDALRLGGTHITGYTAVWGLLRSMCTPGDIEDMLELFDMYSPMGQYPVMEITVTRGDMGIIPGRNTVIWEIRHY